MAWSDRKWFRPAGESQAGYTLLSNAPVVVEDLATETRFHGPALLTEHGVVSGMTVVIRRTGAAVWRARRAYDAASAASATTMCTFSNPLPTCSPRRSSAGRLEEELLAATGREQRRIGQDLHDGLCQHLAGIEFRNEALARDLEDDSDRARGGGEDRRAAPRQDAAGADAGARVHAGGAGEERPHVRAERIGHEQRAPLTASSAISPASSRCWSRTRPTATHLYRIAQEALSNAVRHARAKTIEIALRPAANEEAVFTSQ